MLPISGGAFPVQLGLLAELSAIRICPEKGTVMCKPDIVIGSSGGNIAAYLTMAAEWTPDKIKEIAGKLRSSMFIANWWPRGLTWLPSWMIGAFKGSVYANGTGATELFREYFPARASITDVELWVGTLNRDTGKGQIFCNRSKDQCRIRGHDQDLTASYWSHDIEKLTYLDGDIDIISQVALASASIPTLCPEKVINNQRYSDGGSQFASPLTPLQDTIRDFTEQEHVHIDYISSFDMQISSGVSRGNLYDNGTATIGELVKSLCIQDRLTAIELLRKYPTSRIRFAQYDGNARNLQFIEEIRKTSPLSVLELYPTRNEAIELLTFQGSDIVNLMNRAREAYGLRFWYITFKQEGESLRASKLADM